MPTDNSYSHSSYGTIRLGRYTGKSSFFCVEPELEGGIYLEISSAKVDRHLSRNWVHTTNCLLRARLSSHQFAEAITNLNNGSGIPITLEYVNGMDIEKYEPLPTERDTYTNEIEQTTKKATNSLDTLENKLKNLLEKGKANKGDLQEILSDLSKVKKVFGDELPFIEKSFQAILDKQTNRAKVEFTTWMDHQIYNYGLSNIREQQNLLGK